MGKHNYMTTLSEPCPKEKKPAQEYVFMKDIHGHRDNFIAERQTLRLCH